MNDYIGSSFELNYFSARFNERMNFQSVSPRATSHIDHIWSIIERSQEECTNISTRNITVNIGCSCVYRAPVLLDQFMPGPQVTKYQILRRFPKNNTLTSNISDKNHIVDCHAKSENSGKEEIDLPGLLNLNWTNKSLCDWF